MNKNFNSKLVCLLLAIIFTLTGCSSSNSTNSAKASHTGQTIYSVEVKKVKTDDDGDFIVSGKTNAPDGSKILAEGKADESENEALNVDEDGYAKVKKHKFVAQISADDLTDSTIKEGLKIKARIFAITKYHVAYDDFKITKKVQKAAKSLPFVNLKVDSKLAKYFADDDDSDSDTDDDDSDDSDADDDIDDEDDSEDDNEDVDDEDDDSSDASDEDTNDDDLDDEDIDNNVDEDTDDDLDDQDNADDNENTDDKIYTGDSSRIIGDKATMKYHVPGQAGYYIDKENVIYFDSEAEAQAKRYVKSKR